MAIRTERVLLTAGALLVAGILVMAAWASRQAFPVTARKAPWIAVPAESEFRADASSRAALSGTDADIGELFYVCGDSGYRHLEERYVAIFDIGAFSPDYRASFEIRDSNASVEVEREPPLRVDGQVLPHPTRKSFRVPVQELAAIQKAWSDPAVWRMPMEPQSSCIPGGNSILQSCVHGRYTYSRQPCGNAAVETLRSAIQRRFPLTQREH